MNIVDMIKKIAQDLDVPKRTTPIDYHRDDIPIGTSPSISNEDKNIPPHNRNIQTGGYVVGASSIREMQNAIKRFVDAAVKYRRVPNTTQISKDDTRKDFNDFLAEQYSANSSVHGDEWTTDAGATKKEQKQPTEIIELNNVLDQLYRTGPGKSERMADGVWDFRTNNAIKNICAVADALVRVTEDFGGTIPNKSFTRANLAKLMGSVPRVKDPRTANPADLKHKADVITAEIDRLTEFYKGYHKYVVDHPAYKDYINVQKPLFAAKPGGDDPGAMSPELKQLYNDKMKLTVALPGKTGSLNTTIELADIKDVDSLQRYMSRVLGYDSNEISNEELIKKIFNAIYVQVTNAISIAEKMPGVISPTPVAQRKTAPAVPAAPAPVPSVPQPPKPAAQGQR